MKRFLLAAFLFFSGGLSAQVVDSFMVEGKMFKLEIPQDWVLEEKADGVQGDSTWNVVIRYGIDDPKLNSRIAMKIERRPPPSNEAVVFNKRSKVNYGYVRMGQGEGAYASIQYPKGEKCTSCIYEYTEISVYYLNEKLNLTLVSSSKGKKGVVGSLRQMFFPFRDDVFMRNEETLRKFRTLYDKNPRWVTDSVNLLGTCYRFTRDSSWKSIKSVDTTLHGQKLALNCFLADGTQTMLVIDIINTTQTTNAAVNPTPAYRPWASTSIRPYKKERGILTDTTSKIQLKDSTGNIGYKLDPAMVKLFYRFSSPGQLYLFVKPTAPGWENYELAFSIRIDCISEDYLLRQYYTHMLEDFIQLFLEENQLSWQFTSTSFTGNEVPSPSAPPSGPGSPQSGQQ